MRATRTLGRSLAAGLILAVLLGVGLARTSVGAQAVVAIPLSPGFTPDPVRLRGRAGGPRLLPTDDPTCAGFFPETANHRVELGQDFSFLRLIALAPGPTVLSLRGPDGIRCARGGETAPVLEGAFRAGTYAVAIGAPEEDEETPYELLLSEMRSVSATVGGRAEALPIVGAGEIGLDVDGLAGRFRDRRLRRGFLPDPREDEGEASGTVDIRSLGAQCRGVVDEQPNHVLTVGRPANPDGDDRCSAFDGDPVEHELDYFRVRILDAPSASLLVRTPDGRYLCSSEATGGAAVEQEAWPVGCYRIWVGVPASGVSLNYRIRYTEVRPAR